MQWGRQGVVCIPSCNGAGRGWCVSQHAMGQAGGGVYPIMQWGRQGVVWSRRHASYWNASLLRRVFIQKTNWKCKPVTSRCNWIFYYCFPINVFLLEKNFLGGVVWGILWKDPYVLGLVDSENHLVGKHWYFSDFVYTAKNFSKGFPKFWSPGPWDSQPGARRSPLACLIVLFHKTKDLTVNRSTFHQFWQLN